MEESFLKPINKIEQKEEIKNQEGIDFVFSENPNIERIALEQNGSIDFSLLDKAEFISLYRAEGKIANRECLPKSSKDSAGTWFTKEQKTAETYLQNKNYQLYKIDVPKEFYEGVKLKGVGNIVADGECKLPIFLAEQKRRLNENNIISKNEFKNFLIHHKKESGEINLEDIIKAKEIYSNYLENIFPKSIFKEIVYHGGPDGINVFDKNAKSFDNIEGRSKGRFFTGIINLAKVYAEKAQIIHSSSKVYSAVLNVQNPAFVTDKSKLDEIFHPDNDSMIHETFLQTTRVEEIVVFEPNQINILGSQKDEEAFKQYLEGKEK